MYECVAAGGLWIGYCSSATALFEFLLNPTIGNWSDAYGRRAVLLMGPVSNVVTSVLYCLCPKTPRAILWMTLLVRTIGNAFNTISGSTGTMAGITDICKNDTNLMSTTLARFTTRAGVGVF